MQRRGKGRATAAALSASSLLFGCGSTESLADQLKRESWSAEPVLVGAESVVGDIDPSACEDMFDLLQEAGGTDAGVSGFRHETGAYLLIREWTTSSAADFAADLEGAASDCHSMTMQYDSAVLDWAVTEVLHPDDGAAYRLKATDDADAEVANMLVAAQSDEQRSWLVRVLSGPKGPSSIDEEALAIVSASLG